MSGTSDKDAEFDLDTNNEISDSVPESGFLNNPPTSDDISNFETTSAVDAGAIDIENSSKNYFSELGVDNFGNEGDTEDDDDTVNVIIKSTKGSIYKTGTTYHARSQQAAIQGQKTLRQGVNMNDPGCIQGISTIEFNISSLGEDDKLWKRPGADITDYFNYGFTEDTWLQYCEKQKILRQEYANTALKPVLVGAAGFGLSSLSSNSHRGGLRFSQQQNKDIHVLSGLGRSPSGSEEELDKRNGLLGPGQTFNIPPPCFAPSTGGDALGHFGNVANALNFPPPGFTNTSVPPPLLASGFTSQQASHQWPQSNMGSGLLPLFPGQPVRSGGGRNHHSESRRDRSPENAFSDEEPNDCFRSRYRGEDDQESRHDRDHRMSRRSRSRSRDYHYGGRSRRYHEVSSREYSRHGDRSSRRRGSRERRRDKSHDRDHSLLPAAGANSSTSGAAPTGSGRSVESKRRGEKESRRSHRSQLTSRHRSPSSQTPLPDTTDPQLIMTPSQSIDPLEAASAAAADISEKIRRANANDGLGLNT